MSKPSPACIHLANVRTGPSPCVADCGSARVRGYTVNDVGMLTCTADQLDSTFGSQRCTDTGTRMTSIK